MPFRYLRRRAHYSNPCIPDHHSHNMKILPHILLVGLHTDKISICTHSATCGDLKGIHGYPETNPQVFAPISYSLSNPISLNWGALGALVCLGFHPTWLGSSAGVVGFAGSHSYPLILPVLDIEVKIDDR